MPETPIAKAKDKPATTDSKIANKTETKISVEPAVTENSVASTSVTNLEPGEPSVSSGSHSARETVVEEPAVTENSVALTSVTNLEPGEPSVSSGSHSARETVVEAVVETVINIEPGKAFYRIFRITWIP